MTGVFLRRLVFQISGHRSVSAQQRYFIKVNNSTFPPHATSGFKTSVFRLLCMLFSGEPVALKYWSRWIPAQKHAERRWESWVNNLL